MVERPSESSSDVDEEKSTAIPFKKNFSISTYLNIYFAVIFVIASVIIVYVVNKTMYNKALYEAERKAQMLLDRNLATHQYFTNNLKPKLFKTTLADVSGDYFEPSWMSSTYAIRQMHKYFSSYEQEADYYYKECAINARSEENEAAGFEREFIKLLNLEPNTKPVHDIKEIDGKKFFIYLQKGETMEKACLRCHSSPDQAPAELLAKYGSERSFNRQVGDVVSAVSIRIPVGQAFAATRTTAINLSIILLVVFSLALFAQYFFINKGLIVPLINIRDKSSQISFGPHHLGEKIDKPVSKELCGLVNAFNNMSVSLRESRDGLEQKIHLRTVEIERQKQFLVSIIDSLSYPFYVVDVNDYSIKLKNLAARKSSDPDMTCFQLIHEMDGPCSGSGYICPVEEVKKTGKPVVVEHKHFTNQKEAITEIHAHPVFDLDGNIVQVIRYSLDITERKKTEEALKQSRFYLSVRNRISELFLTVLDDKIYEEVLKVVLDVMESPYGFFGYIDKDGALYCPSFTSDVWDQCEMENKDVVFPRESWAGLWGKSLLEKKTLCSNEKLVVPDGHIPMKRALCVPILLGGKLIGQIVVSCKESDYTEQDREVLEMAADYIAPILNGRLQRDAEATERLIAEEALKTNKYYLEKAQQIGKIGTWQIDVKSGRLFWTDECYKLFGVSKETPLTFDFFMTRVYPDDREELKASWNAAKEGADYDIEHRVVIDGKIKWIREKADLEFDENGVCVSGTGFAQDITELKLAKEREMNRLQELAHASRLSVMGQMSTELAHELNQPLQAILANGESSLRLVKQMSPENEKLTDKIETVIKQSDRAGKIISRIRAFAAKDLPERKNINLNEVISDALEFMDAEVKRSGIKIVSRFGEIPLVNADKIQIEQVIINLLQNGIDSIRISRETGGEIIVETNKKEDFVEVSIKDNGAGVEKEMIDDLFEPFSTSKKDGLGMGLSISRSIIESHGGRLLLMENSGNGVTVVFTILEKI